MEQVQALREKTDAGIMDCKKALTESNGDFDKAVVFLREKGMANVAKKAGRIASNGRLGFYNHMSQGQIGAMVEINCETDFVARSEKFIELVNNVAMHVVASRPKYVKKEDIPAQEIEQEADILRKKLQEEGKPSAIIEKIVTSTGLNKFYKEVSLLDQEYVKNPSITVAQLIDEATMSMGEKISIRRFIILQVGEGMEKRNWNE